MRAVSRESRRPSRTPVSGWIAAGSAALALTLPTPYIVEGPGPAIDVLGERDGHAVLSVAGGAPDPGEGTLDMTTVMVSGPPTSTTSAAELLAAVVDPVQDAVPRELVHPTGVTAEQVNETNAAAMADSQDVATAAALTALGREYLRTLMVRGLAPDSGAAESLREGDVILTAGGAPVDDVDRLRDAVEAAGPDPVEVTVRRDGVDRAVTVALAPAPDGAERRWQMGAFLGVDYDLPVDVEVTLEDIGGPSAGLMFALGVIERLTPGALTGGARIAGTGTITDDGAVGPIGGIPQKVRGAADAGADVFLAPQANCPDLAGRVPEGLTVYAVDTLATARDVVEAVGRGERPANVATCG